MLWEAKPGERSGLGVMAAMGLAFGAQLALTHIHWVLGVLLYLVAAVTFGVIARRNLLGDRWAAAPDTAIAGTGTWPRRSLSWFLGAVFLLIVLVANVDVMHLTGRTWALQFAALAVVLVAGIIADLGRGPAAPLPTTPLEISPGAARILLAVIVAGGAWFRFHDLAQLPFGFWFDEADVALIARRMNDDGAFRPVFVDVMPAYHGYIISLLFAWFGESITAVRSVSAAFGVGTIIAGYLVGRELFGRSAGLVLAYLVAFSRWSLTLSRIGMHNVTVPFFSLMMLALTLRAYRRRSTLDFVLAGLFAGGGMIFYSAMSASVVALAIFAFVAALRSRERLRWSLPRFAAALLAALILFAPLGKFVLQEGDTYFARNGVTAVWSDSANLEDGGQWAAVKENIVSYGGMVNYAGDPNGRHNLPGSPMLAPLVGALAVLGLAVAAFRLAKTVGVLVGVWLPMSMMPGVLSLPWEAPNSLRAVAMQPVALILATAAVAAIFPVVASSVRVRRTFLVLGALGLGVTGIAEVGTYFGTQADDFGVWAQHSTKETQAAKVIAAAPADTYVQAVEFLEGQKTIDFLAGDRGPNAYFGTDAQLPLFVAAGHDALIVTVPEAYNVTGQLVDLYPDAEVTIFPTDRSTELITVRVPAEAIADTFGWTTTVVDGKRRSSGTLLISEKGIYRFRSTTPDAEAPSAEVIVDGERVAPCLAADAVIDGSGLIGLGAGNHRIVVVTDAATEASGDEANPGPSPEVEWMHPLASEWERIPEDRILQAHMLPGGLLGTRYSNPDDRAAFNLRQIDATLDLRFHKLVLPRPFLIEWEGGLSVPVTGEYVLTVKTDDAVTLSLNGEELIVVGAEGGDVSATVQLQEGIVGLDLTYLDVDGASRITLEWTLPERFPQVIPAAALTPWSDTPGC